MTIAFYSVAEHHALAIRPIYLKMKQMRKDVTSLLNMNPKTTLKYSSIVSSTAPDIPQTKRKNTLYHFHSLHPMHANPTEQDYKYMQLFKGVMFPGEWWVNKWKGLANSRVVGWPKSDLLYETKIDDERKGKTVLYASGMHDFDQLKTLKLLIKLGKKLDFQLMVKPHGGRELWYPELCKAMRRQTSDLPFVRWCKPSVDIAQLFHYADVLISESSGSLWEFLATGKPSIQADINAHRWSRLFPGGVLKPKLNRLEHALKSCLDNPKAYDFSDWRRRVMGEVDGKATDRAIKFIEEVFNE